MKRARLIAPLALFSALLIGCGAPPQRQFYTLSYAPPSAAEAPALIKTLRVKKPEISDTYKRSNLVTRPDSHEVRYARRRQWSEKPQRMIAALQLAHIKAAGIAEQVTDAVSAEPAQYVLESEILALEGLEVDAARFAHLSVVFRLLDGEDKPVWRFTFDDRRAVGLSARGVARGLSVLLKESTEAALADLRRHLRGEAPKAVVEAPKAGAGYLQPSEDDHPQLLKDDTPMPMGFGAIFLPTLSAREGEPIVTVVNEDTQQTIEGRMGRRLVLPPGRYDVRFGSGAVEQQLKAKARVEAGRVTLVEARWSALEVVVLDERFVPFRGSYEVIRMENREDFGVGFGADEQIGEENKIWLLKPGLYKIIRAGGTYRDRTDFATVRLVEGALTRFTLVQDPISGDFLGAGEVLRDEEDRDRAWRLRGVLGGDVAFNQDDRVGEEGGWSLSLSLFFDGALRFQRDAHLWQTRLELEEEQFNPPEGNRFRNLRDRLYLHTIYTYHALPWFGPYVRSGVESKLLSRYEEFEEPRDVRELDADGALSKPHIQVERVQLGGPFSPVSLLEGAGGNFKVLRKRQVELDFRLGLGARQSFARESFDYNEGTLIPIQDKRIEGVEATILTRANLTRWVILNSEFEGLYPFGADDDPYFSWRNQVSLRLAHFVSLNYRFNAVRDPNLGVIDDEEIKKEHDVQLRFSLTLF
ncbi:PqiC family protein [Myxococcota bacterium]|nr:PqiC family protein [Myxococcota bacterium]